VVILDNFSKRKKKKVGKRLSKLVAGQEEEATGRGLTSGLGRATEEGRQFHGN